MKQRNSQKVLRGKGPRNQPRSMEMHLSHPPPINPQIKHSQRLRYVVTTSAALAFQVTFANVLDGIIVATTTTSAKQLFDQVKIRAVEVWAAGTTLSSNATPATVSVTFNGDQVGASGSARVFSDTSVSIEPAHIRATPDKMSQAAQWQANGAGNVFTVTAPLGAIIDVDVSFRNDDSAPSNSAAVVAAVAGEVYYRGLDSVAIAATQFVPQAPLTR